MTSSKPKTSSGMTLVEVIIVVAIFSSLIMVINTVIFSAQSMWSSTYPYSTLEEEALKIFIQLKGDLATSAVMRPPTFMGTSDTSLLPHIPVTGGSETEGFFGDTIEFLIPKYTSSNQPIISVSGGDIQIDWGVGYTVNYFATTGPEEKYLVRTVTDNSTLDVVKTDNITDHLFSIEFRDHDLSPNLFTNFYTVHIALVLRRRTITGRHIVVRRETMAYLRNSQGADDLGE